MKQKSRIVIIGGIAAGTSAAAKARRFDESAEIVIYEKDEYISYGTCGLPYFISGKIDSLKKLLVNTAELFESRFNVRVHTGHEVTEIDPKSKSIHVRDLKSGREFKDSYGKLIITTGSRPIFPELDGSNAGNIFTLKTINDALGIKEFIERPEKKGNKRATIIGGGFIGLELLESLQEGGYGVTILEKAPQILPVFDSEMTEYLENYLIDNGIEIIKEDEAVKLHSDGCGKVCSARTLGGKIFDTDIVLFGIGTRPDVRLAGSCGVKIGDSGAIKVDEYMRTSIEDIYAAGDCCECNNVITGDRRSYNLASIAVRQGRIAGYNAAGGQEKFTGSMVAFIIRVMDAVMAKVGLNYREALSAGLHPDYMELHYGSHADYYPGSEMMHMMLIYQKGSGRILGMEACGRDGIDKRVDVVSAAMKGNLNICDLADIDLGYQPAYGSARDSVNILGMMGENILNGELDFIKVNELKSKVKTGQEMVILDVRTRREHEKGSIEGSILIPVDRLRDNLDRLDRDKDIIIYCKTGYRAYLALRVLKNNGFKKVRLLNGSYMSWARKL